MCLRALTALNMEKGNGLSHFVEKEGIIKCFKNDLAISSRSQSGYASFKFQEHLYHIEFVGNFCHSHIISDHNYRMDIDADLLRQAPYYMAKSDQTSCISEWVRAGLPYSRTENPQCKRCHLTYLIYGLATK